MQCRQIRDFSTSVYAAVSFEEELWFGGSAWRRRSVPYEEINSDDIRGELFTRSFSRTFPSMIYTLIGVGDAVYIGMKRSPCHVLIGKDGDVLQRCQDEGSDGVYNASRVGNHIICSTRSGDLVRLSMETFSVEERLSLTDHRLWSLIPVDRGFVCGDYEGRVFLVSSSFTTQRSFDLKDHYGDDARVKEGFGPSAWDACVIEDDVVVVDRWGGITVFDEDLSVQTFSMFDEYSFTTVLSYEDGFILGDRYGRLLRYKNQSLHLVVEHEPTIQKENAIWCLERVPEGVVACFADGQIELLSD